MKHFGIPIRKVIEAQEALREVERELPGVTLSLRWDKGWCLLADGPEGRTRTRLARPFRYHTFLAIGLLVSGEDCVIRPIRRSLDGFFRGDAA